MCKPKRKNPIKKRKQENAKKLHTISSFFSVFLHFHYRCATFPTSRIHSPLRHPSPSITSPIKKKTREESKKNNWKWFFFRFHFSERKVKGRCRCRSAGWDEWGGRLGNKNSQCVFLFRKKASRKKRSKRRKQFRTKAGERDFRHHDRPPQTGQKNLG